MCEKYFQTCSFRKISHNLGTEALGGRAGGIPLHCLFVFEVIDGAILAKPLIDANRWDQGPIENFSDEFNKMPKIRDSDWNCSQHYGFPIGFLTCVHLRYSSTKTFSKKKWKKKKNAIKIILRIPTINTKLRRLLEKIFFF